MPTSRSPHSRDEAQPLLSSHEAAPKTPPWTRRWWAATLGAVCVVAFLLGGGYLMWKSTQGSYGVSNKVKWDKCGDNLYCGRLEVPLDYDNPKVGSASLYLVKYPHKTRKKQGTIFSNPGGPGVSGSSYNYRTGAAHSALTGGGYDIVGWDPRGVNFSTPRATCFQSLQNETKWLSTLPLRYELPTHLPGSPALTQEEREEVLKKEIGGLLDRTEVLGRECVDGKDKKAIWNYMDTASNVRDIARMADLFDGEGAPINYWGKSYGTFLGNYLINMYPDRVGRVILDGAGDPRRWSGENYKLSGGWFGNIEDTFDGFLAGCVQAGDACPLTRDISENTVDNLRQKIDNLIIGLEAFPRSVPIEGYDHKYYFTAGMAIETLFQALYTPRLWPRAAENLQLVFENNTLVPFLSIESFPLDHDADPSTPASGLPYAEFGVECSDTQPNREGNRAVILDRIVQEKMSEYDGVSKRFAGSIIHTCDVWPKSRRANKRYTGPWNHKLKNEIVIISVTADPVAPVEETRKIQRLLKGQTRVIWQKGFGHCSPSQASLCTAKYVLNHFKNGKLPPREVECEVTDGNPWTITKGLTDRDQEELTQEDDELLMAMRSLA